MESKAEKIRARGERCNAIVALGLAHDAEGRFPLWEDQAALAACVQNMYLMCTAHGIGGFWSTPGFWRTLRPGEVGPRARGWRAGDGAVLHGLPRR